MRLPVRDGHPVVTQSMITAFQRCPLEAVLTYACGQAQEGSEALSRGTRIHAVLEHWLKTGDRTYLPQDMTEHERHLLAGYRWHWAEQDSETDVVTVESKISAPIGVEDIWLEGVLDAVVQRGDTVIVQDHKTHKRIPDWDHRLTNAQAPLYLWLLKKAYDLDVNNFEWDYICTADYPQLKLTKSVRLAKQSWGKLDYIEARRQLDNLGVDTHPPELEKLRQLRGLPTERYSRVQLTYTPDRLTAWIARVRTTVQMMLDYPDDPALAGTSDSCLGPMCGHRAQASQVLAGHGCSYGPIVDPLAYHEKGEYK